MRFIAILAVVTATLFLASAGAPATRGNPTTTPTTVPTVEELHIASFDNADEVNRFLQELKKAEEQRNKQAIVSLVRFPFTRYDRGEVQKEYKSKSDLLRDFDKVFTNKVLDAIRAQRFETLFFRDQGAMIGRGNVWFDKQDQAIRIKAVNP